MKVIARLVPVSSNSRTSCCPEAQRSATGGSSSIFGTIAPTPSSALQRIAKFWADVDAGNEPKPDFYRDDAIIKALHKGDTESLTHDPILFEEKGDMIGVYSVVTLKDGAKVREFMDMNQLKKIQATSKTGDSEYGPWKKWFEEMCVKSMLKKVSKLCPQSSDIDQMLREDDDGDDWTPAMISAVDPADEPVAKKQTRAARAVKEATTVTSAAGEPAAGGDAAQEPGSVVDAEFSTEEPSTQSATVGDDEPPM